MATKRRNSLNVNVPEDLIVEILSRVPAASLARFRLTSKRWNALIKDGKLAEKHSANAPRQSLVIMVADSRVFLVNVDTNRIHNHVVKVTGRFSLKDPLYNPFEEVDIYTVYHCDGLLLCSTLDSRLVVWNPCTGRTKWIQPRHPYNIRNTKYVLGSYQDIKSGNNSYKLICYKEYWSEPEFTIYEINSNSWRVLDVNPDGHFNENSLPVSFKGKTYWFAFCEKQGKLDTFLVSFDYTTERVGRVPLPHRSVKALSVVREEKLAVLVEMGRAGKEIWVTTDKVAQETKVVSWRKVFAMDYYREFILSSCFLFDEEKKLLLYCEKFVDDGQHKSSVYVFREGNEDTQLHFGCWPVILNYVPSLVQIEQTGCKRKRGD